MMNKIGFSPAAWEDYEYWETQYEERGGRRAQIIELLLLKYSETY